MMELCRPFAGRAGSTRGAVALLFLLLASFASTVCVAAEEFPYDQELMLDAARMGHVRRMPMLVVSQNGDATIQLWCKDVAARVHVSGDTIAIEPGPLPDALPAMMSDGQCSPQRMQADADMLAALAQMTAWQSRGSALVLSGPTELRFFQSTH